MNSKIIGFDLIVSALEKTREEHNEIGEEIANLGELLIYKVGAFLMKEKARFETSKRYKGKNIDAVLIKVYKKELDILEKAIVEGLYNTDNEDEIYWYKFHGAIAKEAIKERKRIPEPPKLFKLQYDGPVL